MYNIKWTWQKRKEYQRTKEIEACKYENARDDFVAVTYKIENCQTTVKYIY